MRHPLKLQVQQKKVFSESFNRYYNVEKLLVDGNMIKTEAQLCGYLFRKHGKGRYKIVAWQKGHKGWWMFWIGNLHANGFIRDQRKNVEMDKLQQELKKAKTYEDRDVIEQDLEIEREIHEIETKIVRRGPVGLKKSRPGILHPYEVL